MVMNTMCIMRKGSNNVDHEMMELGKRVPMLPKEVKAPNNDGMIEPNDTPYTVQFRCRRCGDSGIFDQNGVALEYHQVTTIYTGRGSNG